MDKKTQIKLTVFIVYNQQLNREKCSSCSCFRLAVEVEDMVEIPLVVAQMAGKIKLNCW